MNQLGKGFVMYKFAIGLCARFTSRKFLMAAGTIAYGVYTNDQTLINTVVVTYLAAEGLPDAVTRFAGEKTAQSLLHLKTQAVSATGGDYLPPELADVTPPAARKTVPGDYSSTK